MKKLEPYLIVLGSLIISSQLLAGKQGNNLSKEDITKSTARVQHAFSRHAETRPIIEKGTSVGEISSDRGEFYITFRPSLGLEILNCTNKGFLPLRNVGLNVDGHGHQGLTQLFSKEEINKTVISEFTQYKQTTQLPPEQMTIFLDGMSAGAHRAVETALYLKQYDDTKDINLVVLRYGDPKTFDDIAVDNIHKLLGENNIISFHAQGDKIVEFMDLPNVRSYLGTRVDFSATASLDYNMRVSTQAYTCMDPKFKPYMPALGNSVARAFEKIALRALGITPEAADFLTPELWELHQPKTYSELAPCAFKEFTKKPN